MVQYLCSKSFEGEMEKTNCELGPAYPEVIHHHSLVSAARGSAPSKMLQILVDAKGICCGGCEVLLDAIEYGATPEVISTLLQAGADPNWTDWIYGDFRSPLTLATDRCDLLTVQRLLAAGAHPDGYTRGQDSTRLYSTRERFRFDSKRPTPLLSAVLRRDTQTAAALINGNADPNVCASDMHFGQHDPQTLDDLCFDDVPSRDRLFCPYPIQAATANGDMNLIKFLYSEGAVLDPQWGSPLLSIAAHNHHPEIVLWLLQQGLSVDGETGTIFGLSALEAAIFVRDLGMVKLLCQQGANMNRKPKRKGGRTSLQAAGEIGNFTIYDFLLENGANIHVSCAPEDGISVLEGLIMHGAHGRLRAAIQRGAYVRRQIGCLGSPLCAAIIRDDLQMLATLIEAGADINERAESALKLPAIGGPCNSDKWCFRLDERIAPIHLAALSSSATILEMLVAGGADLNSASEPSGATPLLLAILGRNNWTVEYLVRSGADVNPAGVSLCLYEKHSILPADPCHFQANPLMQAVHDGQVDSVALLLSKGAEPNTAVNKDFGRGWTFPLEEACAELNVVMVQLLLEHGADARKGCPIAALLCGAYPHRRFSRDLDLGAPILGMLLKAHADPDVYPAASRNPLALAAGLSVSWVKRLVGAGASIELALEGLSNVLTSAIESREALEICQYVLAQRDLHKVPKVAISSALEQAALFGLLSVASLLLEHGAKITEGAITKAARCGRLDMMQLLLDNYDGPLSIDRVCQLATEGAREEQEGAALDLLEHYQPPARAAPKELTSDDLVHEPAPSSMQELPANESILVPDTTTPGDIEMTQDSLEPGPAESSPSAQLSMGNDVYLTLPNDELMDIWDGYGL